MKKIILIISCIGLTLSALLLYVSMSSKDILKKDVSKIIVEELHVEEEAKIVLASLEIPEEVQTIIIQEIVIEKQKLIENEEFNIFIDESSETILRNIADPNSARPDTQKEVQEILQHHFASISLLFEGFISETQVKETMDALIETMDLNFVYDTVIDVVEEQLTSQQKMAVSAVAFLCNDICKTICIVSIIGFILLLLWLAHLNGIAYIGISIAVSGIILFVIAKLVPTYLTIQDVVSQEFFSEQISRMESFSLLYMGVAGISLLSAELIRKKRKKQLHN